MLFGWWASSVILLLKIIVHLISISVWQCYSLLILILLYKKKQFYLEFKFNFVCDNTFYFYFSFKLIFIS